MTRHWSTFRPQHDEGCGALACSECGHLNSIHQSGVWCRCHGNIVHKPTPKPCSCGLDDLLRSASSGIEEEKNDQGAGLAAVDDDTTVVPTTGRQATEANCLLCISNWPLMTRFDATGQWHQTPNGMFRCVKGDLLPEAPDMAGTEPRLDLEWLRVAVAQAETAVLLSMRLTHEDRIEAINRLTHAATSLGQALTMPRRRSDFGAFQSGWSAAKARETLSVREAYRNYQDASGVSGTSASLPDAPECHGKQFPGCHESRDHDWCHHFVLLPERGCDCGICPAPPHETPEKEQA